MDPKRLAATLCALSAVVGVPASAAFAWPGFSASPRLQSTTSVPTVTVTILNRGTETDLGYKYGLRIRCSVDGVAVPTRPNFDGTFQLAANGKRAFGRDDFPTLTPAARCTVAVTDSNGAPVRYSTTLSARTDGSVPTPLPGQVTPDGYLSSAATADGQTITAEVSFSGDLAITQRVTGAPSSSSAIYETLVTCPDTGYSNSVSLGDGQLQILTGIPAGSVCSLVQNDAGSSSVHFEDNSGNPGDATVTITGTRADCWDLRNASADCRATVIVTNAFDNRFADPQTQTDEAPTTTTPNNEEAPATTAAPAVSPAPAIAVEAAPAFAG